MDRAWSGYSIPFNALRLMVMMVRDVSTCLVLGVDVVSGVSGEGGGSVGFYIYE